MELPPPPPKRSEKRNSHIKRSRLDSTSLHLDLNSNGLSTGDSYAHSKGIDRKTPGVSSSSNGLTLKTPQLSALTSLATTHLPTKFSTSPSTSMYLTTIVNILNYYFIVNHTMEINCPGFRLNSSMYLTCPYLLVSFMTEFIPRENSLFPSQKKGFCVNYTLTDRYFFHAYQTEVESV